MDISWRKGVAVRSEIDIVNMTSLSNSCKVNYFAVKWGKNCLENQTFPPFCTLFLFVLHLPVVPEHCDPFTLQ